MCKHCSFESKSVVKKSYGIWLNVQIKKCYRRSDNIGLHLKLIHTALLHKFDICQFNIFDHLYLTPKYRDCVLKALKNFSLIISHTEVYRLKEPNPQPPNCITYSNYTRGIYYKLCQTLSVIYLELVNFKTLYPVKNFLQLFLIYDV